MNQDKLQTLLKEIVKAIVLLDENTPYTFERHLSTLLTEAFAGDLPKCNCKMYEWEHYPKEFCKPDSCSSKCDEKRDEPSKTLPCTTLENCIHLEPAPEKWKPKVNGNFFVIDSTGSICSSNSFTSDYQKEIIAFGNCFQTESEAERVKQQWLTMRGV